jgi:hypothetical protein
VVSLRGEHAVEGQEAAPARDEEEAAGLGARLAERLLEDGASSILAEVRAAGAPAVPEP